MLDEDNEWLKLSRTKIWLIWTVMMSSMPIFLKFLAWLISNNDTVKALEPSDIVIFGLILHVSIINELQHIDDEKSKSWKTVGLGLSIIFIILYSFLFGAPLFGQDSIETNTLLFISISLAVTSLFICIAVYKFVSNLEDI